jgi:flagellar assembly protein FliH
MGFTPLDKGRRGFTPLGGATPGFRALRPADPDPEGPPPDVLAGTSEDPDEMSVSMAAEGREEGYEKGYQEGLDQARAELAATVETAQGLVKELQATRARVFDSSRNDLIDLLAACLEWLHLASLESDQELIVRVVDSVLADFQGDEKISLHVNPEDHDTIVAELSLGQRPWTGWDLTIVQDEALQPGGCLVKAPEGSVDATVTERLSRLHDEIAALRAAEEDRLVQEDEL